MRPLRVQQHREGVWKKSIVSESLGDKMRIGGGNDWTAGSWVRIVPMKISIFTGAGIECMIISPGAESSPKRVPTLGSDHYRASHRRITRRGVEHTNRMVARRGHATLSSVDMSLRQCQSEWVSRKRTNWLATLEQGKQKHPQTIVSTVTLANVFPFLMPFALSSCVSADCFCYKPPSSSGGGGGCQWQVAIEIYRHVFPDVIDEKSESEVTSGQGIGFIILLLSLTVFLCRPLTPLLQNNLGQIKVNHKVKRHFFVVCQPIRTEQEFLETRFTFWIEKSESWLRRKLLASDISTTTSTSIVG